MSDVVCNCLWETCLELQSDPLIVALCLVGVHGENQAEDKAGFYQHHTAGQVSKYLSNPESSLCSSLPISCLLGSVTEKASGVTIVARCRFSVSHQVGASGVQYINAGSNSVPVLGLSPLK